MQFFLLKTYAVKNVNVSTSTVQYSTVCVVRSRIAVMLHPSGNKQKKKKKRPVTECLIIPHGNISLPSLRPIAVHCQPRCSRSPTPTPLGISPLPVGIAFGTPASHAVFSYFLLLFHIHARKSHAFAHIRATALARLCLSLARSLYAILFALQCGSRRTNVPASRHHP